MKPRAPEGAIDDSADPPPALRSRRGHLLIVADHPSSTRYAWDFIGDLYARIARRLHADGIRVTLAFPRLDGVHASVRAAPIETVELAWPRRTDPRPIREFIRAEQVSALYLTDREAWDPRFLLLRASGVRTIFLHDHTSGSRSRPTLPASIVKRALRAIPGTTADLVIAVSEFVASRHREVECLPADRVEVVPNSILPPDQPVSEDRRRAIRRHFSIPETALVIASAGRIIPEKGFHHLIQAFEALPDQVTGESGEVQPIHLLCLGEGGYMDELLGLRETLSSRARIHLPGYVPEASGVLGATDITVVPSIWAEAFGLSALETMASGVPVVVSDIGGLREVVRDGVDGRRVPAGSTASLREALAELISDPFRRREMGAAGRKRARSEFSRERQVARIIDILYRSPGLRPQHRSTGPGRGQRAGRPSGRS